MMPTNWVQDAQTGAAQTRKQGGGSSLIDRDALKEESLKRAKRDKSKRQDITDADVEDQKREAQEKAEKWRKLNEKAQTEAFGEGMEDPAQLFGQSSKKMEKEDGGGGVGTVAVSSDPGVFTETYGARKQKVMSQSNPKTKKSSKSGPEKLDEFLQHTSKSLDDESFLIELLDHVRKELRQEDELLKGAGPYGTYTPYNERPYQPPFPHETKRKGRNDKVSQYPTTENTVPVNMGAGALGQSNIPQETVMAEVGVDDARNMNRSIERRKKRQRMSLPQSGVFLNPGNESGNNFQDTAVAFTAMQKMPTHGNTTANTPKQFSTERPQEPFIERKPRIDPNSDIEQKEFEGNAKAIDDDDKSKKGRSYEPNKESNSINSTRIETYSANMGGHALQAMTKEMRDVGLDSLHRESDDKMTEPDEENTEELHAKSERELPRDKDIIHAEKSAMQKMMEWVNEMS